MKQCSWCEAPATGRAIEQELGESAPSCGAAGHGVGWAPV